VRASKAALGKGTGLNMCENEQKSDGSSTCAATLRLVSAGSVGLLNVATVGKCFVPRAEGGTPLGGCGKRIEFPSLVSGGNDL
jgi:hypothetical protein